MSADEYRRLVKSMGGSSVLDGYKNLQEGLARGVSPPPAVHGVPHGTWAYVFWDSSLQMKGPKRNAKKQSPNAGHETTRRWCSGTCRSECTVKSYSGATPVELLQYMKLIGSVL